MKARDAASAFGELFPALYLRFHRRARRDETRLTPQMWAVLQHLAMSGPLTVTEAARHMQRAQSVMSEIVDGLVRKGLLERMRDARDRRRTLVWLNDRAHDVMAQQNSVLEVARLEQAMRAMRPSERTSLIDAVRALVRAAERLTPDTKERPS